MGSTTESELRRSPGEPSSEIPGVHLSPIRGRNMSVTCGRGAVGAVAEHAHDTLQMTLLFEPASCLLRCRSKRGATAEHSLLGPALVMIGPGQLHSWEWGREGDAIVMQVDQRLHRRLLPVRCTSVVVATPSAAQDLMVWQFANVLRQLCFAAEPGEIPLLALVAESVAMRIAAVIGREVTVPERSLTAALIKQVEEFVRTQLAYDIHVDDLARVAGYSVPHFSTLFKAAMGITPSEYIFSRRMVRAEELLRTGNYLIGEVARLVGYLDQGHFTGLFRTHFGYAPRAVLQQARVESANRPKIS